MIRSLGQTKSRYFILGMMSLMAVDSLLQDYWGMEEFIRRVQADWISPIWTVPIALLILGTVIVMVTGDAVKDWYAGL